MLWGFPCFGYLPNTGVFAKGGSPPLKQVEETINPKSNINWNAELFQSVQTRGDAAAKDHTSEAWIAICAVWTATATELDEGWAAGRRVSPQPVNHEHAPAIAALSPVCSEWTGLTASEIDAHQWIAGKAQWRSLRRFGVFQKGKWRPIDDATEAGFRDVTGSDEKISLIRSDSPARVAAGFYSAQMRWQERLDASRYLGPATWVG